jgi:hypothetical protein
MATDIFFDNFLAVIDATGNQITDELKAYTALTITNGRIIFQPGVNAKIIPMIQWVRNKVNMSRYPMYTPFHPPHVCVLTAQHQTFLSFRRNSEMNAKLSKPRDFKDDNDWDAWLLNCGVTCAPFPNDTGPHYHISSEKSLLQTPRLQAISSWTTRTTRHITAQRSMTTTTWSLLYIKAPCWFPT